MRWAALFADLEAQLAAAEAAERDGEVADRQRLEVARTLLVDRLRAATGTELTLGLASGTALVATITSVGADWLLVAEAGRPDALVPAHAIAWVRGLPAFVRDPDTVGVVESRLDLAFVLRGLGRDRLPVRLDLADRSTATGTIDRVGRDFIDVAEHPVDDPRRPSAVRGVRTVPLTALVCVRPG